MAGISIKVKFDEREVTDFLGRLQARGKDLAPVFKDFGEYMVRETEERFEGEYDPEGKPWTPLSTLTLAKKKNTKILTEDSFLRGDIHYEADNDHAAIGTGKIYGAIHQLGGMAGRGRKVEIKAREYLGVNDENESEFIEIVKDHLNVN
jgi:phage virion morphogenesis protein